jgi:putative proteasome-type protease
VQIDASNQYMTMIRNTWGTRLKQVFAELPNPTWSPSAVASARPAAQPIRAPRPPSLEDETPPAPPQLVAGQWSR